MNARILERQVQAYINENLNADVTKIALSKSPFNGISSAELANQISAKKKSERKLPTWFRAENIYYPTALSIEQTSSEKTAAYKQQLIHYNCIIDITSGFGVDSFYFAKVAQQVYSCEINPELSRISAHNVKVLSAGNVSCLNVDGLAYLAETEETFDTVYVDPARRNTSGKVFKLADCTPNVVDALALLFNKAPQIIIKTSPLLDLQAGLLELKNVSAVHILSVKNECKELLWVLEKNFTGEPTIHCATINKETKVFSFPFSALKLRHEITSNNPEGFLYEPDVALMKSGAFDYIAEVFGLQKLATQSHLYFANEVRPEFPGRIFEIRTVLAPKELKKDSSLTGNVIIRNYPDKAENLVKKYKIGASKEDFLIFTSNHAGNIVIDAKIVQYY